MGFCLALLSPPYPPFVLSDCKLKKCLTCLSTCSCKRRNMVGNSASLPTHSPLLFNLSEAFHLTVGGGVAVVLSCPRSRIVPMVIIKTGKLLHSATQVQTRHLKLCNEIRKLSRSNRCLSLAGALWCVSGITGVCLRACVSDLGP